MGKDALQKDVEAPTREELALAYRVSVRNRATDERIVQLISQGKIKFAIWGPGEEIHGTAAALAFHKVLDPKKFGVVAHYRSGTMCHMWCALQGYENFTLDVMRQQLSKATDTMSGGGRQMVYHLCNIDYGILPIQSPVGMQLDKAAGYAKGFQVKGIDDAVVVAVLGDGTSAEGDLHDAMHAVSIWGLPVLFILTDNELAISTKPCDGRGIKDYEAYCKSFGVGYYRCNGTDWDDCFKVHSEAARTVRETQRAAMIHVVEMPRLNGHSSAGNYKFALDQVDPILDFGGRLVAEGVLSAGQICKRIEGEGADYYAHHDLGEVMTAEDQAVRDIIASVSREPEPDPDSIWDFIYNQFPAVEESAPGAGTTNITYAAALRAAQKRIFEDNPCAMAWGQDCGQLGGVFQATAGMKKLFPDRVLDAPINEPMIVGTAAGAAMHPEVMVLAEIQFSDYSLNAYHWFVYLGNFFWSSGGQVASHVICRMPTDPFGGGAIYHSMSVDGWFTPIPGLVIVMPSTSWDAYGLLRTCAAYRGPVLFLEPKWMYRQTLGPAFPGEVTEKDQIRELKQALLRGAIPEVADISVPIGKGIIRREGSDVTIVSWGRAVWTSLDAARTLAEQGIEAEVIDLRTLVPPDMELIRSSVGRTGRLMVAAEDRTFGGFGRELQGSMVEENPGLPTRIIGMYNVPAVAQSATLEQATILTAARIETAVAELMEVEVGSSRKLDEATPGWSWIPQRFNAG